MDRPPVSAGRGLDPYAASSIRVSTASTPSSAIRVSGCTAGCSRITSSPQRCDAALTAGSQNTAGPSRPHVRRCHAADSIGRQRHRRGVLYARRGGVCHRDLGLRTSCLEPGGAGSHLGSAAWTEISTTKASAIPTSRRGSANCLRATARSRSSRVSLDWPD